jgi:hypothetical protein
LVVQGVEFALQGVKVGAIHSPKSRASGLRSDTRIKMLRALADEISCDGCNLTLTVRVEADERLRALLDDLAVVLPFISTAAGQASKRTKAGKALREAANRLAGDVLSAGLAS